MILCPITQQPTFSSCQAFTIRVALAFWKRQPADCPASPPTSTAPELLTHGEDGLLLSDPADDQKLASHMHTLLDPALRRRMGETARGMSLRHTMDHNCDQIIDLYYQVLESRKYKVAHRRTAAA